MDLLLKPLKYINAITKKTLFLICNVKYFKIHDTLIVYYLV